ncbi:hypothetical protein F5Y15DRAFT_184489 [Xylariaceae sp. FL0016]|nr:hypothetical protein F5Y15DRAFT_184489 [Xylariaceae sp. FL0016]
MEAQHDGIAMTAAVRKRASCVRFHGILDLCLCVLRSFQLTKTPWRSRMGITSALCPRGSCVAAALLYLTTSARSICRHKFGLPNQENGRNYCVAPHRSVIRRRPCTRRYATCISHFASRVGQDSSTCYRSFAQGSRSISAASCISICLNLPDRVFVRHESTGIRPRGPTIVILCTIFWPPTALLDFLGSAIVARCKASRLVRPTTTGPRLRHRLMSQLGTHLRGMLADSLV